MTRVSADKWTATVEAAADTTLSYKYDLGGNWNNVEETAGCGDVGQSHDERERRHRQRHGGELGRPRRLRRLRLR